MRVYQGQMLFTGRSVAFDFVGRTGRKKITCVDEALTVRARGAVHRTVRND